MEEKAAKSFGQKAVYVTPEVKEVAVEELLDEDAFAACGCFSEYVVPANDISSP